MRGRFADPRAGRPNQDAVRTRYEKKTPGMIQAGEKGGGATRDARTRCPEGGVLTSEKRRRRKQNG